MSQAPDDSLALALVQCTDNERKFIRALAEQPELRLDLAEQACGLAQGSGSRYLKKPHVREAFRAIFSTRRERYSDIREGVLQALWALATWDIKGIVRKRERKALPSALQDVMFDPDSHESALLPPDELPDEIRAAIKSVKYEKGEWSYTFCDRHEILLNLLKHFGDVDKLNLKTPQEKQEGVTIIMYGDTSSDSLDTPPEQAQD